MEYHANPVTSVDLIGTDRVINDDVLGKMFLDFISEFRTDEHFYANQLASNTVQQLRGLTVQLEHVAMFSQELYDHLLASPERAIAAFERALSSRLSLPSFQIQLVSTGPPTTLREMGSSRANRIIKVQGIIISTTPARTRPVELFVMCRNCLGTKLVRDAMPRACDRPECPVDPYVIVPEKSTVVDVQYAKIQEYFEDIPMGETPRHLTVILEGALVDQVSPGDRVALTGILQVRSTGDKSSMAVRVIGVEGNRTKLRRSFTTQEELAFKALSQSGDIYERVSRSIAPGIYGHGDVKKALACLLFGGVRRTRGDGIRLRGDINVLLLGDPGIAKSQMLKFVESVAPIGVYTSGKGSSAAGLTAAVVRDRHGEFYLEGGAMVLADRGVCCIDEFDKMGESDRVAIHEAMEQQTISIAKAGITTMLSTQTAVLAAANPAFGRYDDYKTPEENIEFGSTILSRFDLIFILKDRIGPNDMVVAEHVLNLHKECSGGENNIGTVSGVKNTVQNDSDNDDVISMEMLKSYIQYAKMNVEPTLSPAASERLSNFYTSAREEVRDLGIKSAIPVTVRQLEAIVRLSEAIARIELKGTVTVEHVEEAIRLFQLSTMHAVAQGHMVEGMVNASIFDDVYEVIQKIKECMPVGISKKYSELCRAIKAPDAVLKRAVDCMVKQSKMISRDYGRVLVRLP